MVTRAIIEKVTDKGAVVRIPTINKSSAAVGTHNLSELDFAPNCTLPGISPYYQVGDAVFVTFEDDNTSKPLILGKISSAKSSSTSDIDIHSLKVSVTASLPKSSNLGEINCDDLSKVNKSHVALKEEITRLTKDLEAKNATIEKLKTNITNLEQRLSLLEKSTTTSESKENN